MKVTGKVLCPNEYADKTKSVEISFHSKQEHMLPFVRNGAVNITILVDDQKYIARIRHTDKNGCWISPDLKQPTARLSDVIFEAGFKKNDEISIELNGNIASVVTSKGNATNVFEDEIESPEKYTEGSVKQLYVNAYERNSLARKKCIDHYGTSCIICGFNFKEVYGNEAEGFIHVHHIKPLHLINQEYTVNQIEDLRPVCPNCHAYIHLGGKCRSIKDVGISKK
ncbi:HNH endonuclease [Moritella dasanensis]|uniref:HNH endonuclease n=1 Tax=Moritella dasanensis TaxID=428031 RepID=UPI00030F7B00|nr:HNH endonuclease [Moritella dasanensis]